MFNSLIRGKRYLKSNCSGIAEVLAMNALPDEPAIGVDIQLVTPSLAAGRYSSSLRRAQMDQVCPGGVDALDL